MADAASERKLSGELLELTDSLVADIDPEWSYNAKLRWEMSYVDYCETGKAAHRDSDSSFALEPSTRHESNTWTPGETD